jgi:DegV family protein with EDD domain
LGSTEGKDGVDITPEVIFDYVSKTGVLPKTTALNAFEYEEFFTEVLKDADAIVHLALSSGLSSSYSHAVDASKNFKNVYVVDSNSLSTGIGVQAIYARKLTETIDDPAKIAQILEDRKKYVQASFIVERLDYLYKGGRCSGFQLLGANVLKIRPRLVLKEGKMIKDKTYKGAMHLAVKKYAQECLEEFHDIDTSIAFITYSSATPEMVAAARQALESVGVENIYETSAGATITSHCGEHTLGILYYNDGQKTI